MNCAIVGGPVMSAQQRPWELSATIKAIHTFAAATAAFCTAIHGSRASIAVLSTLLPAARPASLHVASAPATSASTYSRLIACRASRLEAPVDLMPSCCCMLVSASSEARDTIACAAFAGAGCDRDAQLRAACCADAALAAGACARLATAGEGVLCCAGCAMLSSGSVELLASSAWDTLIPVI